MPSANAKWRGYVSRNMRKRHSTLRTGTVTSNKASATAIGGGAGEHNNAVAGTNIANATAQLRHQPGKGAGGGVL